ncbi:MAG: DUF86 domain-containing protein [Microcystis aeruginosa LL13-03]|nr:DUF86 domain-containing protein [Microcystis aeruginosa LL13-03]
MEQIKAFCQRWQVTELALFGSVLREDFRSDSDIDIDIVNAIRRILRYTDGISQSELEINDEKLSAILYQITIIGEATKRLSVIFRQQHPEIPWREMAGMRDVIVHKYDQLDLDVVWDIVENKLTELLKAIAPLL